MHVLHAIHDFLPRHQAGSELYALRLAGQQLERHHVTVLCADFDPAAEHGHVRWRMFDGVPIVEIINNWRCASFDETYRSKLLGERVAHVLETLKPDVVHVHSLLNLSFDLPVLANRLGIPVVATLHDYTLLCPSGGQRVHRADQHVCEDIDTARCARCFTESAFYDQTTFGSIATGGLTGRIIAKAAVQARKLMPVLTAKAAKAARHASRLPVSATDIDTRLAAARQIFSNVDLFVSPSPNLARDFARHGLPAERLRVSDYGMPDWKPVVRRPPATPVRIGMVGTLTWHKGVHVLIDALEQLPEGSYHATIHGSTGTFPDYSTAIRSRASRVAVRFAGAFPQDRAPEIYADIDVLVVPSLWPENSPLVIHEAFQSGAAVVASRIGGIQDLVADGVSGLLFAPGSASELASHLRHLIENPNRISSLASSAPAVKSIAADSAAWDAVYRDVIRRREARPA